MEDVNTAVLIPSAASTAVVTLATSWMGIDWTALVRFSSAQHLCRDWNNNFLWSLENATCYGCIIACNVMNYCLNRVAYLKIICAMNMSLLPHDIGFLSHFSSQWCSQWCCHDSSHNCRGYYCTACCCTVCGRLCCATIQKEGHSVRYMHMPYSYCYMCLFYWVSLSKLQMDENCFTFNFVTWRHWYKSVRTRNPN